MTNDGMIQPSEQSNTPPIPAIRIPTNVDEFMDIGPGVISATVIRVGKFLHSHKVVYVYYLFLNKRNCGITAADAEQTDLYK